MDHLINNTNLNKYIYFPQNSHIEKFEEYFRNTFNTKINYIIKNEYIYLLNNKDSEGVISNDNFNPEIYEFSEGDYRMLIKYVKKILNF